MTACAALENAKDEWVVVLRSGRVCLAMGFGPLRFEKLREVHVADRAGRHLGEIHPLSAWQGKSKHRRSADHTNLLDTIFACLLAADLHGLQEILTDQRARRRERSVS